MSAKILLKTLAGPAVGGRIYPDGEVPPNCAAPFAAYRWSPRRTRTMMCDSAPVFNDFAITVFHKSTLEADAVAAQMVAAIIAASPSHSARLAGDDHENDATGFAGSAIVATIFLL